MLLFEIIIKLKEIVDQNLELLEMVIDLVFGHLIRNVCLKGDTILLDGSIVDFCEIVDFLIKFQQDIDMILKLFFFFNSFDSVLDVINF